MQHQLWLRENTRSRLGGRSRSKGRAHARVFVGTGKAEQRKPIRIG